MDEILKKKIYWLVIVVSVIVLLVSVIGQINLKSDLKEISLPVNRSPLIDFRLIDYKETKDGVFIDVVGLENGVKYADNFISKACPYGKTKKIGMVMKLSVVENINTYTNEKKYELDRAYDYLCTNLDMASEDEKLLNRIKEARERQMKLFQNDGTIKKS